MGVQLCSVGGKFRSTVGRTCEAISLLMQYVSIGVVGYKDPLCRSQFEFIAGGKKSILILELVARRSSSVSLSSDSSS